MNTVCKLVDVVDGHVVRVRQLNSEDITSQLGLFAALLGACRIPKRCADMKATMNYSCARAELIIRGAAVQVQNRNVCVSSANGTCFRCQG